MPGRMGTQTKRWWVGALTTIVLGAGLGGVAQAQIGNHLSLSFDGGLMHSTSIHLVDTTPFTVVGNGDSFVALPYLALTGLWEHAGLVAGVRGDLAIDLTGPRSEGFLGGITGFRFAWGHGRLQIAAELGEHLLGQIGGVDVQTGTNSVLLPFAGASIDIGHANGVRPGHLGLSAFIRQDLEHRTLTTTEVVDDQADFVHFTYQANYALGGTMVGLALNVTTN